jgi:hypothetical protein
LRAGRALRAWAAQSPQHHTGQQCRQEGDQNNASDLIGRHPFIETIHAYAFPVDINVFDRSIIGG